MVEGRKNGRSFNAIAKELGISTSAAHKLFVKAIDLLNAETHQETEHVRQLSVLRLEAIHREAWIIVTQANTDDEETGLLLVDHAARTRALNTCIRANESLRKLYGIDPPTRHEHSGPGGAPIPLDIEVGTLDDEALERELAGFTAGVEAEKVRAKEAKTRRKAKPKAKPKPKTEEPAPETVPATADVSRAAEPIRGRSPI